MKDFSPQEYYRRLLLIRIFEERLLDLFSMGELTGTTHCYIGQEAIAVGIIPHLLPEDIIFSSHRCHGHYLARTENAAGLFAEIMGKPHGICGGKGGSQHLCDENFYSNGVQGSFVPISVGMAFAEKRKNSGGIVAAFIGDGTLGEGVVYEALNMAALFKVPLLIVVENNMYAQTTSIKDNLAGSIPARFEAFGIPTFESFSQDVLEISAIAGKTISYVRKNQQPAVIICHTYRFCAHSKGDDFRDLAEVKKYRQTDPVGIAGERLSEAERGMVLKAVITTIQAAENEARKGTP